MMGASVRNCLKVGAVVGRLLVELMVIVGLMTSVMKGVVMVLVVVVVTMAVMKVEKVLRRLAKILPTYQRAVTTVDRLTVSTRRDIGVHSRPTMTR